MSASVACPWGDASTLVLHEYLKDEAKKKALFEFMKNGFYVSVCEIKNPFTGEERTGIKRDIEHFLNLLDPTKHVFGVLALFNMDESICKYYRNFSAKELRFNDCTITDAILLHHVERVTGKVSFIEELDNDQQPLSDFEETMDVINIIMGSGVKCIDIDDKMSDDQLELAKDLNIAIGTRMLPKRWPAVPPGTYTINVPKHLWEEAKKALSTVFNISPT